MDDKQQVILKDWLAKMPAKRKGFEADVVALRAELSKAILTNAPKEDRMELAEKIGVLKPRC